MCDLLLLPGGEQGAQLLHDVMAQHCRVFHVKHHDQFSAHEGIAMVRHAFIGDGFDGVGMKHLSRGSLELQHATIEVGDAERASREGVAQSYGFLMFILKMTQ